MYVIDVNRSTVAWSGKKKVGMAHAGQVGISEGTLEVKDGDLVGGTIVIDMTSIEVDEMKSAVEKKLLSHLASDDFFSAERFPTASLSITGAEPQDGLGEDGATHTVTADMTIKGITNEVSFPAQVGVAGGEVTMKASFDFDRSRWDVRFGSSTFFDNLGDGLIENDIGLDIEIVATQ